MRKATGLALLCWACLPAGVLAQGYVGLAGGFTRLEVDCLHADRCDRAGNGFKVYGGYSFSPGLAAELVYLDFGKARSTSAAGLDLSLKATAVGAGLAYARAVGAGWSVVGRAGLARVRATESGTANGVSVLAGRNAVQPYGGVAANYAISDNVRLNLGLDLSRLKYGSSQGLLRLWSAGVDVSF